MDKYFITHLELKSAGGYSTFPNPELPPWEYDNPAFPWSFEVNYEGTDLGANAYTLMSEDGVLISHLFSLKE